MTEMRRSEPVETVAARATVEQVNQQRYADWNAWCTNIVRTEIAAQWELHKDAIGDALGDIRQQLRNEIEVERLKLVNEIANLRLEYQIERGVDRNTIIDLPADFRTRQRSA
jgi:hypothetical protein